MNSVKSRIALVTGANRGLGLETARQLALKGYHVLLAARNESKAKEAAEKLVKLTRGTVTPVQLDVTSAQDIEKLATWISKEFGKLDVLVNNAGILKSEGSALTSDVSEIRQTLETNLYGPFQLMQKLIPLMRKNGYGRVVNVSSGMGQLSEMNGGYASYRVSKTALNALTRIFSEDAEDPGIKVNSVCPGWVKTDMGGAGADRDVEEGADTIVWLATLPENGPTGGFFRDREPIEW